MEKITRTIPTHVISATVVEFDKVKKTPIMTEIKPVTVYGGTMTDELAMKELHKAVVAPSTPVLITNIETTAIVYEISVEDFIKYAVKVEPKPAAPDAGNTMTVNNDLNIDPKHMPDIFAPGAKITV